MRKKNFPRGLIDSLGLGGKNPLDDYGGLHLQDAGKFRPVTLFTMTEAPWMAQQHMVGNPEG